MAPPIAIIAPAHNEESSIRVAVRNLLELDYPELEIIVVNDGSEDRTLEEMREEFRLRLVRAVYIPQVKSAPVRGLYRSDVDARLLVVDKEAGGSKADAVNAGLNAANSPYVCVVDADSVLERDALLRIMVPILEDPKRVVAVGGIIRERLASFAPIWCVPWAVTGLTPSVKTLIWWLACTGICSIKVSTIKSALCPIPCAGRKSRPT